MKLGPKHINPRLYKKILQVLPISCVDVVVALPNGRQFLLGKRTTKPAKGRWFIIGGRVLKGEKLEQAVRRHIKVELGNVKFHIVRQLGAAETIFHNSAQGPPSHTINTVYLVRVVSKNIKPANKENKEFRWFSKLYKEWHPYVRKMLREAGFRQ